MKFDDFTSAESWTILTRKKVVKNMRSKYHVTTSADVMLGTIWRIVQEKATRGRYCVVGAPNNESRKNSGKM